MQGNDISSAEHCNALALTHSCVLNHSLCDTMRASHPITAFYLFITHIPPRNVSLIHRINSIPPTPYAGGMAMISKRGGVLVGPWSVVDVSCIDISTFPHTVRQYSLRHYMLHTANTMHTMLVHAMTRIGEGGGGGASAMHPPHWGYVHLFVAVVFMSRFSY
jgi:hypothetical protein